MFSPSHVLISRTRETPVQLVASRGGYKLYTEIDWQRGQEPAFELRPKQGLFCRGVHVVGFRLAPLASEEAEAASPSRVEPTGAA
jgi:hypothetical protein